MGGRVQLSTLINAESLKKTDSQVLQWTADNAVTPNGGTSYMYIACFAWKMRFVGNYALFGSPTHTLTFQYWNGQNWVDAGSFSSNNNTRWASVNMNDSGANVNAKANTYIWRVRFQNSSGYYKGEGDVYLYLYGIGSADNFPEGIKFAALTGDQYSIKKRQGADTDQSKDSAFDLTPAEVGIYDTHLQMRGTLLTAISPHRFIPKLDDYAPSAN